ncbi:leucyl/phenylalanyl-tRNA--protein transferase [Oceanispirochaeta crateris]|uniref:leucyl/phenylalanyl-tRNA--protein transferase n=1 Tax=Oceanispirochaeta crateris TaxID=2518645 RepID=UPI001FE5706B|nr:leucyl/phenylalanyl-tRNA--protein transferase [Oceanispirochaeta crateris]
MRDEDFPWLEYDQYFPFPPEETWEDEIVGVGGNLSPGLLLSAYVQGIFPWFNEGEEILWWSLDPRFVLYHENLKVSRSMRKVLKSGKFTLTLDRAFRDVMTGCGKVPRKGQDGTWISSEMLEAYCSLHELGFAHSVEVWEAGRLAGGLYGLSLGRVFFGESMFALSANASKTALIALSCFLQHKGFAFIDCQQHTEHLGSLGACDVPRSRFLKELKEALTEGTVRGNWSLLFPGFPESPVWTGFAGQSEEAPG